MSLRIKLLLWRSSTLAALVLNGPLLMTPATLAISPVVAGATTAFSTPATDGYSAASGVLPEASCPPWVPFGTANPQFESLSDGHLVLTTSTFGQIKAFVQTAPQITLPDRVVVEANMRYISGSTTHSARAPAIIDVSVAPSVGNAVFIGQNEIFILAGDEQRGQTASVPTTDGFHTYRLEVTASTGAVQVFYDGALKLAGSTFANAATHGDVPRIFWGQGSTLAVGTTQWSAIRHNAIFGGHGATPACSDGVYPAAVLADRPSLYYRLGEPPGSKSAADSSGNGVTGTYTSAATLGVPGPIAGETALSGAFNTSVMETHGAQGLPVGNSPRTLEAWIKTTTSGTFFNEGEPYIPQGNFGLAVEDRPARVGLDVHFDAVDWDAAYDMRDDKWHYIVITYDGTVATAYADGVSLGSQSLTRPGLNTTIDAAYDGMHLVPGGSVSQAAVYDHALNADRVQAHYAASGRTTSAALTTGPVSRWPADGNANDVVGSNNGTLQGGVAFGLGKVGQGFRLNGTDGRVYISNDPSLSITDSISVDAWINPASTFGLSPGGAQIIIAKHDAFRSDTSWYFRINDGGALAFDVDQDGAGTIGQGVVTAQSVVLPNVFTHVAATFNVATQATKIYVNGVTVPVTPAAKSPVKSIFVSSTPVYIGTSIDSVGHFNWFFKGMIDDVEVFNRALGDSEIQAVYAMGVGPTDNVAYTSPGGISANNGSYTFQTEFNFRSTPLSDGSYGTLRLSTPQTPNITGVVQCVQFVGGGVAYAGGTLAGASPGEGRFFARVTAGGPGQGKWASNANDDLQCPDSSNLTDAGQPDVTIESGEIVVTAGVAPVPNPANNFSWVAPTPNEGSVLDVRLGDQRSFSIVAGGDGPITIFNLATNLPDGLTCSGLDIAGDSGAQVDCTFEPTQTGFSEITFSAFPLAGEALGQRTVTVGSGRYVAMGDSYSSGEGTASYDSGTDTGKDSGQDSCHRASDDLSKAAYPALLVNDPSLRDQVPSALSFVACSGSTIDEVVKGNRNGNGEASQMEALDGDVTLVTLSVGGDDLGFSSVLENCVNEPWHDRSDDQCSKEQEPKIRQLMDKGDPSRNLPPLNQRLIKLYKAIHDAAPRARILVMGYPHIFPLTGDNSCGLPGFRYMDANNINWLNKMSTELRGYIRDAVQASGVAEFVDAYDALVDPSGVDHSACGDNDTWENELILYHNLFGPVGCAPHIGPVPFFGWRCFEPESFHPNPAGYRAFATVFAAYIQARQRAAGSDPAPPV